MSNQTQESLQVDCIEGYSSGLTQEFHMEVFSGQNHQLIVNITARSPKLLARGLPPGRSLFLRVYASNAKGRSRSVTFDAYTLRMADKHPGNNVTDMQKSIFLQILRTIQQDFFVFINFFRFRFLKLQYL